MWAVPSAARSIIGWSPLVVGPPPMSSSNVRASWSITSPTRPGIAFFAAAPLPASTSLLVQAGGPNGPPPIEPEARGFGIRVARTPDTELRVMNLSTTALSLTSGNALSAARIAPLHSYWPICAQLLSGVGPLACTPRHPDRHASRSARIRLDHSPFNASFVFTGLFQTYHASPRPLYAYPTVGTA
ncbi:hypothetical protein FRC08_012835 [Ceratobasidium sp. 394]|nr:hypothetical protein FRC08_012835 [Ceratobasidium sp. 394]